MRNGAEFIIMRHDMELESLEIEDLKFENVEMSF
jgi:hypothetical protein